LQELVVGRLLNLDEVRHLGHFLDLAEELSDPLATGKRLRHCVLSLRRNRWRRLAPTACNGFASAVLRFWLGPRGGPPSCGDPEHSPESNPAVWPPPALLPARRRSWRFRGYDRGIV